MQATWYTSAVAIGMMVPQTAFDFSTITASDFCTQSLSLVQAMQ